jgi:putative transcriptional regulator
VIFFLEQIIHGRQEIGGQSVMTATNFPDESAERVYLGGDLEAAACEVEENRMKGEEVMFFNGSSTWTAGQLDGELRRGTWVPVQAPVNIALGAKKNLWKEMMEALGGEFAEFSQMPPVRDL